MLMSIPNLKASNCREEIHRRQWTLNWFGVCAFFWRVAATKVEDKQIPRKCKMKCIVCISQMILFMKKSSIWRKVEMCHPKEITDISAFSIKKKNVWSAGPSLYLTKKTWKESLSQTITKQSLCWNNSISTSLFMRLMTLLHLNEICFKWTPVHILQRNRWQGNNDKIPSCSRMETCSRARAWRERVRISNLYP